MIVTDTDIKLDDTVHIKNEDIHHCHEFIKNNFATTFGKIRCQMILLI